MRYHKIALLIGLLLLVVSGSVVAAIAPGDQAPDFTLLDTAGKEHHLQEYLDAGLGRNKKASTEYEMPFPILMDEPGTVGRLYGAKTSPHMFVINADGVVVYNGAIDDNPSPSTLGETNYVHAALQSVLAGAEVETASTRPYGCSVKYGK